jgi:hypothetical protein
MADSCECSDDPSGCHHGVSSMLLWSPGYGGSESKTRRREFLLSQVGDPNLGP